MDKNAAYQGVHKWRRGVDLGLFVLSLQHASQTDYPAHLIINWHQILIFCIAKIIFNELDVSCDDEKRTTPGSRPLNKKVTNQIVQFILTTKPFFHLKISI